MSDNFDRFLNSIEWQTESRRLRRAFPPEESEDIIQETLVSVWSNLNRVTDNDPGTLVLFARRSVSSMRRRLYRQRFRTLTSQHDELEMIEDRKQVPPINTILIRERTLSLYSAMLDLPKETREIFRLRIVEERSFARIGKVLHISSTTANRRYQAFLDATIQRLLRRQGVQFRIFSNASRSP